MEKTVYKLTSYITYSDGSSKADDICIKQTLMEAKHELARYFETCMNDISKDSGVATNEFFEVKEYWKKGGHGDIYAMTKVITLDDGREYSYSIEPTKVEAPLIAIDNGRERSYSVEPAKVEAPDDIREDAKKTVGPATNTTFNNHKRGKR